MDAGNDAGSADLGISGDLGPRRDFGIVDAARIDADGTDGAALDEGVSMSDLGVDATVDRDATADDAASTDVDASFLYTPPDYTLCDGNTFFPDGSCADGACASSELQARVYAIWKARFLETHRLDAAQFAERIEISSISLDDGPVYVWWRVDYVFHIDWVRSRQSESVNLGEYPRSGDPSDEEITHAVDIAIETAERFDVPLIAQFESVVDAVVACSPYVSLDWCQLDFENVSGNPIIHTRSSAPDGVCKAIQVQLEDASTDMCLVDRCTIHF